ncbi:ABC transporter permease [Aminipila sp.]|uniref:ABC transporter permease n=1 Tax=Aminipila sp. TaxID=2060095 RepID=UPI002F41C2FD
MKWYSKTYIGVFLAFLYLPIMILIIFSFNDSKGRTFTGFTTKWFIQLFNDRAVLDALWTTVIVALVSATIATIMGTAAAIGLEKMDAKIKSVFMNLTYVPIINPEIITGVSFMLLFVTAKKWLAAVGIDFEFGWTTLILAHITFNVPYVILNVLPKLRQLDNSLVEAAMDLGCNPLQAFLKVAIHEIKPGIIAGFLMALTFSMDDFVVSYFTTGAKHQTLSVMIYAMTKKRVSPEINALSTIIFIAVLAILVIINLAERKAEKKLKQSSLKLKRGTVK